jgi:hypothetical protein
VSRSDDPSPAGPAITLSDEQPSLAPGLPPASPGESVGLGMLLPLSDGWECPVRREDGFQRADPSGEALAGHGRRQVGHA